MKKRLLSILLTAVLLLGLLVIPAGAAEAGGRPTAASGGVDGIRPSTTTTTTVSGDGTVTVITEATGVTLMAGGWFETICAEVSGVTKSQITAVSWSGPTAGSMTASESEDNAEHGAFSFKYLVREVDGKVRIDIPGVAAGTYTLTVTAGGTDYTAQDIEVKAYDRSGFAHKVHTTNDNGDITGIADYTEGVGAYNDDGTLKENALVVYVTDENKDTINITTKDDVRDISVTGIGRILNSNNSKANLFLLRAITRDYPLCHDKTPHQARAIAFRFVGNVTAPEGLSTPSFAKDKNDQWDGDNGFMVSMLSGANITMEGIGPDGGLDGWGISFGADKNDAKEGLGKNFEVRNLSFHNVPEDCVEITGRGSGPIEVPVEHSWVHNCSFFVPHIPLYQSPAVPEDGSAYTWVDDKQQGDGALDYKFSRYMTSSFNYFEGYHKTSLMGGGDSHEQYHVTWHHNWWKNVESRAPLCRHADVHIYNNLFDHQSSYCMSLRASCYIFSEYNIFDNCRRPVIDEGTGGVCKSYHDLFDNCRDTNNAIIVTDRDDPLSEAQLSKNSNPYAGFELDPALSYIPEGDYLIEEDLDDVRAVIEACTGVMKPVADIDFPTIHHHVWGAWTDVEETTCTQGGHRYRYCQDVANCPLENGLDDQDTMPLGHKWSDWETVSAASCTVDGLRTRECERCDATEEDATAAPGHSYGKDGLCAVCGRIDTATTYVLNPSKVEGIFSLSGGAAQGDSGRVKTNGKLPGNGLKVDVPAGKVTLKVSWKNGTSSASRSFQVLGSTGSVVYTESVGGNGSSSFTVELPAAGTYTLGSPDNSVYITAAEVRREAPVQDNKKGDLGTGAGALSWTCTDEGVLNVEGALPEEDTVLAACWDESGFAGVKLLDARHMGAEIGTGWAKVKLLWLNEKQAPQCHNGEF